MKHSILTLATFLLTAAGSALYSQHPPALMTNPAANFYQIDSTT